MKSTASLFWAAATHRRQIPFATNLFRKAGITAALVALFAWAAGDQAAGQVTGQLTLEQARALAVQSLQAGEHELAIGVSRGLLQADRRDSLAHFVIANAESARGDIRAGRRSAALAYRTAANPTQKYQAAQLASQLAYKEQRLTLSQVWLRRTAIHAPDQDVEDRIASDYKLLRQQNPWSYRFRGDLRPSNNVNNGADTALQIIDGVPVTGYLSGASQALPGLIGSIDLAVNYRLQATENSLTVVGARLYAQRVALTSAAKDRAPDVSNSDFASTFAEVSARHAFALGTTGRGSGSVELTMGESWYGGDRSFRFAKLAGERIWRSQTGQALRLRAVAEDRFDAQYAVNDARVLGIGFELNQPLKNGDRIDLTLAYRDSKAQHFNGSFTTTSFRADYAFGKPVGPVRLSAGLILGYSDYPVFRSGLFLVPGGRQDKSVYGDINMMFHDLDYAGFAPMLRIRAGRKYSNDSRYSVRDISVSLGIESKF